MRPETDHPAGFTRADLLLVLVAVMWGVNFSIIKIAMVDVPPFWFSAFRFVIALAVMLSLARMLGYSLRIERQAWWQVAGLGLLGNSAYQLLFVPGADRRTAAHAALDLAEIDKRVSLHSLRHAFATHLLERKIDIRLVQVLLGHKKITSTQIYSHVADTLLREVVSPLEYLNLELDEHPD